MDSTNISSSALKKEAHRLHEKLHKLNWTLNDCLVIAPLTLEINQLKKEQNAIVLAHSYQTPDIMYGIADFVGDSYGLSVKAHKTDAAKIVFCSVHFMAETVKILSPEKEVLVPTLAGCTLASSITPNDVKRLKKENPGCPVVCYVNTTADVKAESDVCVTSSNALKIINALPEDKIIFIPDELMAKNFQSVTDKKIIGWNGRCIVHEKFNKGHVRQIRLDHPKAKIVAHPECSPPVVAGIDFIGGTTDMLKYVKNTNAEEFFLVTECGLADRLMAEFEHKTFVGSCSLCPFMKKIQLKDVLTALKNPKPNQMIKLDPDVLKKAKKSLERMMELS